MFQKLSPVIFVCMQLIMTGISEKSSLPKKLLVLGKPLIVIHIWYPLKCTPSKTSVSFLYLYDSFIANLKYEKRDLDCITNIFLLHYLCRWIVPPVSHLLFLSSVFPEDFQLSFAKQVWIPQQSSFCWNKLVPTNN